MQGRSDHQQDRAAAELRFAVTVEFELSKGAGAEFLRLVRQNAAASVREEPGCRRFDVLCPETDTADTVFLYEIYDSRSAFDAHLASAHYESFNRQTEPMVRRKVVKAFSVSEVSKP